MQFLRPVKVGDEVTLHARFLSTGRTSMKIRVEAWARNRFSEDAFPVTEAQFIFVALDAEGQPRLIGDT